MAQSAIVVAPDHQGRGIGNELLARTFEHARKTGATTKSLITFTFNVVSQGLYIRHGLFPRLPIYMVSVASDALITRPCAVSLYRSRFIDCAAGAVQQRGSAAADMSFTCRRLYSCPRR
jgi:hypothetical protein